MPHAYAATIHGTVYDVALNKESDVRIDINSTPNQFIISKDGSYSFNVSPGNYQLVAYTEYGHAAENITVTDNGDYVIDIILEPTIDAPINTESDLNASTWIPGNSDRKSYLLWIILAVAAAASAAYLVLRKSKARVDDAAQEDEQSKMVPDEYAIKILKIIKHNKRITQKDLRKDIPLSEAKISLIISEFESEGKIKKIRKGRGNILVYVKD